MAGAGVIADAGAIADAAMVDVGTDVVRAAPDAMAASDVLDVAAGTVDCDGTEGAPADIKMPDTP